MNSINAGPCFTFSTGGQKEGADFESILLQWIVSLPHESNKAAIVEKLRKARYEKSLHLNLKNFNLPSLPSLWNHLDHLEKIDLSHNQLKFLPQQIRTNLIA